MTAAGTPKNAIVLSRLTKSYGKVHAVRGVDLAIAPGETVALLGPNGAGKSTAIDMVLGLARPDSGSVSLAGRTPAEAVAAGLVGAMLQTGALLEYLTVRQLVTMVASLYPHPLPVGDVLELTGAAAFADRRTNKLSGGETQRVRFALAVVGDPDLLVLDEPTAAIDVEGRREFWSAMRAIAAQGKTVIFATHYLEEADAFADRVVMMAHGRIVADGSATEIRGRALVRTIRATLREVDQASLAHLPGVRSIERHGHTVSLSCSDADTALRAFVARYPDAHDIEVRGASIEEAFLELTTEDDTERENVCQ